MQSWNNATISSSVNGYGVSGCCSTVLNFTSADYGVEIMLTNARVRIIDTLGYFVFPEFTVQNRNVNKNQCSFTCVDKMVNADRDFELISVDDTVNLGQVLDDVVSIMGVGAWAVSGVNIQPLLNVSYDAAKYQNKTCRAILDEISTVLLGTWKIYNGELLLMGFTSGLAGTSYVDDFTKIDNGNYHFITGVNMINSETGETYSYGNKSGKVFEISSFYASNEAAQGVFNLVDGYRYQSWSCEKCILTEYVAVNTAIHFGDSVTPIVANNIQMNISGNTVYATLTRNAVTESEIPYKTAVERKLEEKIEPDKAIGSTTITSSGKTIFRNLNKEG